MARAKPIKFAAEDLAKLRDYVSQGPESAGRRLGVEAEEAMRDAIKGRKALDTGALLASVRTDIGEAGGKTTVVAAPTVAYARWASVGRKPGTLTSPAKLRDWAMRKFGNARAAFAISKSLAKKGIKPKRYLKSAGTRYKRRAKVVMAEWLKGLP